LNTFYEFVTSSDSSDSNLGVVALSQKKTNQLERCDSSSDMVTLNLVISTEFSAGHQYQ